MRVLYFSRDYTPHDHRFLTSLAESEHEVLCMWLERRGHRQEDRALPAGITPVRWAGGEKPYSPRENRRLLRDLKGVLREVQPDLVHAGPVQTAAWLAAKAGFEPLVTMSWGSDLLVEAESSSRMRKTTEYTLARTAVLVGDCQAVREKAVELGFDTGRIVTFPWGINLADFSPDGGDHGLRERAGWTHEFVILHLRSWEPVYGVDVLARAFVMAAKKRPDLRMFLLGNGSLAGKIRQTLIGGGVMHQVQMPGQVPQAKLPAYFRAADLYVSASHSDGSSVSLMEGMASGLPALVSDIPGNREWVTEGAQGWLFPDGNAEALAEKILQAAEAREKFQEIGERARRRAETRADWSKNFEKLLSAYDLAVGSGLNE
jgi:glycosyltransferase involved in cell wall biosynthesis